jgi:hypothetical protein
MHANNPHMCADVYRYICWPEVHACLPRDMHCHLDLCCLFAPLQNCLPACQRYPCTILVHPATLHAAASSRSWCGGAPRALAVQPT